MIIIGYIIAGVVGALIFFILDRFIFSKKEYGGVIVVTQNEDKTVYSLELNDYPDAIDFMDEVLFKIERPKSSLRNASVE